MTSMTCPVRIRILHGRLAAFAPEGLDSILSAANGHGLDELTQALRPGGRLAFP